jgi:hypothetical protein
MTYWMVDGRQLTDEQYNELQRQKRLEKQKIQEESNRLSRQLGAAYAALKEHLRRHEETSQQVTDDRAQDQHIYQTLRQNLERADEAPRCGEIKEDGTWCRSPRLKDRVHCYAHYRMKEAQAKKLKLAAVADANGIQMSIMQVQRALIDGEISEKMAGLLLYSLQLAASNVDRTTFGKAKDADMVTEMVEYEAEIEVQRKEAARTKQLEEIRKTSPRINTDEHGSGIGESGHREIGTDRESGNRDIGKPERIGNRGIGRSGNRDIGKR